MSETPQAHKSAAEVPPQTRGQEQTAPQKTAPAPQHRAEVTPTTTSGWVGWVIFGSMMMIMVGSFQVILGLTALLNSDYYAVGANGLVVNVDYTAWGWAHLALGAVALAAAFGLLTGSMWARVLGIAVALIGALVNLAFIAAFPFWCITVIALDVLVIYAIAVHGGELKEA
ncbi:MAG TPA: hypothetical protein VF165_04635 [Nocardioidaceae bacterium]